MKTFIVAHFFVHPFFLEIGFRFAVGISHCKKCFVTLQVIFCVVMGSSKKVRHKHKPPVILPGC